MSSTSGIWCAPIPSTESRRSKDVVNSLRFETVKDYDDWLGRMRNFPAYMDQNIGLMREGIKDHIVLPKVIGEKVLTQLNGMDWQDPTKHGFYKPFLKMPPAFSEADKQRLTAAAQQTIKNDVLPAFSASAISCRRSTCRHRLSQSGRGRSPMAMPPTPISPAPAPPPISRPQQIHEIGLQEVKRIGAEMDKVREQSGFKGRTRSSFTSCAPTRVSTPRPRRILAGIHPRPRQGNRSAAGETVSHFSPLALWRGACPCGDRAWNAGCLRRRRRARWLPPGISFTSTPTSLRPARNTKSLH